MSSTPRPPASGSQNSPDETPDLETGLAALKQKQYQKAIAHLEAIAESQPKRSPGIRAKMALVVAYERTRNPQKAIALCQTLTQHSKAQVKTWAEKTLKELTLRYSLEAEPPAENQRSAPQKDPGFVPFQPSSEPPKNVGFVPLEAPKKRTSVDGELNSFRSKIAPDPKNSVKIPKPNLPESQLQNLVNSPVPAAEPQPEPPTKPPEICEDEPLISAEPFRWRQAERATQWRRLKPLKLTRFYIEQAATVLAFIWLTPRLIELLMDGANNLLLWLPFVRPVQLFYRDPTEFVYISLAALFILSPWLLDGLLQLAYGMEHLPLITLLNQSQEANRILRSYCQQRGWKMPTLRVLPTDAPLAMTYGCWPRFVRIVVSRGLLEQLSEDEIAAIYAREISAVGGWDFLLFSWATVILQVPYQIYWQSARWVEQSSDFIAQLPPSIPNFIRSLLLSINRILNGIFTIISPLSYGVYRLWRWPIFWVSRRRVYYRDRDACNLTGNPNALTRAILKIGMEMAADIQRRGTSSLLEGFDLLMPVSPKQATIFSHLGPGCGKIETLLSWDLKNPDRHWLEINNTHPGLGDRLLILSHYASFWKLNTELDLSAQNSAPRSPMWKPSARLLLQGAPYFGLPAGLLLGSLIWLLGAIFAALGVWQLEWLFGDVAILAGCIFLGCSLGIFLRINRFFPDIKPTVVAKNPSLATLLTDPEAMPIDSQPLRLEGKLLGRKGLSNLMGQDLTLQTPTGAVKLNYIPVWTPLANLSKSIHPVDLIGQSIVVTGWWRRGATAWIDVETMETLDRQVTLTGGHPIWSTILACAIALWGAYRIFQGGF